MTKFWADTRTINETQNRCPGVESRSPGNEFDQLVRSSVTTEELTAAHLYSKIVQNIL